VFFRTIELISIKLERKYALRRGIQRCSN